MSSRRITKRVAKPRGLWEHRLKDPLNYAEKIYADAWQKQRTISVMNNGKHHLDYLLHAGEAYSTEREHEIAATLIQWLGTEVGQEFVQKCQRKVDVASTAEEIERSRRSKK